MRWNWTWLWNVTSTVHPLCVLHNEAAVTWTRATDPLFQVEKIFEKVKFMNLDEDKM
jgi:hypothetical protein